MLFFRRKLNKIFYSWITENSEYYKGLIIPYLSENKEISSEEYEKIYKDCNNQYFKKATDLINNSGDIQAIFRWQMLPLHPNICGYDINYNSLNIGMIYLMVYYCFENKSANINDCYTLNHLNHDVLNKTLLEIANYYDN